jgi:hypothetical protein
MYSPKINEKHIPVLYRISKQIKKPMTYLVNEAVTEYLKSHEPIRENKAGL